MYQIKWDAKIGRKLKASHETRPGVLVGVNYAITLKYNDLTAGYLPKRSSKNNIFLPETGKRSPRKNIWR